MKYFKFVFIYFVFVTSVFAEHDAVDNLASTIATPFYNVYNSHVIELLEQYIKTHPEVEAIKLYDSLIDKTSITYYKLNGEPVFEQDKDFPSSLKLPSRFESRAITKKEEKIGILTLYYQTILGKELLTEAQSRYLNNKKIIKACVTPDRLPLEKIENGKHIGISADLLDLIAERLNVSIQLVPTSSWQESLDFAANRFCDILPLTSSSRKTHEYMDFTSSYLAAPIVIATKKNVPFISDIEEVLDKQFTVTQECQFCDILKNQYPNIRFKQVESLSDGLSEVENGDVFAYLDNSLVLNYQIQRNYIDTLAISGKTDQNSEFRVASRNDEPELGHIFQKAFSSITESRKDAIYKKWASTKIEKVEVADYSLVAKVTAISLFIFSIFIFWNRKLRAANHALEEAKKEIEKLATIDKLTGVYNRMKMDELLESEIQRCKRYNHSLVVSLLDIDHFKSVNDNYGHQVGDQVLEEFAKLGRANMRSTDYFGRWGGEEFLIIMPETDEEGGMTKLEQLRVKFEAYKFPKIGTKTGSFGVSIFKDGDSFESIIKRADDALYEAKESGRNKVVVKR